MSSCPKLNNFCAKSDVALGLFRTLGVGYEYPLAQLVGYKYPPAQLVGYEYPPARVGAVGFSKPAQRFVKTS